MGKKRKKHRKNRFKLGYINIPKFSPNFNLPKFEAPYSSKSLLELKPLKLRDIDKDTVPDLWDCRPHNPKMQDIKPNILFEEEIKEQPIFFTGGLGIPSSMGDLYPYESKRMSKGAYEAKKRFQSAVKSRPEILGEIKRRKPKAVVFTTRGVETHGYGAAYPTEIGKEMVAVMGGKPKGKHVVVVRATSPSRGQRYDIASKEEAASTTMHELEHVRQFGVMEKKPKLAKRMQRGRYEKRRTEVLARKAEEKAERKHHRVTYGSRKYFWSRFRQMTDEESEEEGIEEE